MKKTSLNLPLPLHRKLKVAAAIEGREMGVLLAEAVEAYLSKIKNLPDVRDERKR